MKAVMARARNSFGPPRMEQKVKQVVVDDGAERCPGGRSLCDWAREGGEEAGGKRDRSGVDK